MKTIIGDLLTVKADYIVQQCNCLTIRSHGLSKVIAEKFPYADVYASRTPIGRRNLAIESQRSEPGTIAVFKNVICIFGQWRPGRINTPYFSNYPESKEPESSHQREMWFQRGLVNLGKFIGDKCVIVAFPYQIGCGLAGGQWSKYLTFIKRFDEENKNVTVIIVKLP